MIKVNGKLQTTCSGRISNGQDPSGMKVSVTILDKEQWTAGGAFFGEQREYGMGC